MISLTKQFQLTANNKLVIDLAEFPIDVDACSIQSTGTFSSGVITVKKANSLAGSPVDINGSPVTISAAGVKELTGSDWFKARYLVLEATTAASPTTTIVVLDFAFKKLGFSI